MTSAKKPDQDGGLLAGLLGDAAEVIGEAFLEAIKGEKAKKPIRQRMVEKAKVRVADEIKKAQARFDDERAKIARAVEEEARRQLDARARLENQVRQQEEAKLRELYAILDVVPDASDDEVKRAYKAKAKALHPDMGGSVEQVQRLEGAYRGVCEHRRNQK